MNRDPLAVLVGLDGPVEPRAAFAASLLEACLDELRPRAWVAWRPSRWARARVVVLAVVLLFVLAAVATATYLALRTADSSSDPGPSQLTLILGSARIGPTAEIAAVEPTGRLRTIWRCPEPVFCGDLTSAAWAPNGRRLAFTIDELGGTSGYVGLHVLNLRTGRELHIPSLPIPHLVHGQPGAVLRTLFLQAKRRLGCGSPGELSWSPDSNRLAYVCSDPYTFGTRRSAIFVIRFDGTGRVKVPTRTLSAYWPTWSADGKRLVFATEPRPRYSIRTGSTRLATILRSSVYLVSLDGSSRRRLATDASGPSWSPDGKTIAYESLCGVRLVTPGGVDVTPGGSPACPHIGVAGLPTWSLDGKLIAIGTRIGTYVVRPDGQGLRRATTSAGRGVFASGRAAWAPVGALSQLVAHRPKAPE